MKRIIFIIFSLALSFTLCAQEPGNNLRKSLTQIQQSFPNLTYWDTEKGCKVYKSVGDGDDFTCFYFKNGIVVGEYTYFFDYQTNGRFITDLYNSLLKSFSEYGGRPKRRTGHGYDVTYFHYSNFIIKVANYYNQLQLYYELKGYNIEITALEARP